mmetsp:Transcript_20782/g.33246  ORF Transcript_20782/g.33246 Transcript_20782/m.33246 type:complete len:233 (+) Transcript_20782:43-741(+)
MKRRGEEKDRSATSMSNMNRAVSVPSHLASHLKDDILPKRGAVAPHTRFGSTAVHKHIETKIQKYEHVHHHHNNKHHHHHHGSGPSQQQHSRYTPTVSSAAAFYAKVVARQSTKFAQLAAMRAETRSRPRFKSSPLSSQSGLSVSKIIASLLGLLSSIVHVCLRLMWSTPSQSTKMSEAWQLSVVEPSKVNLGSKGRKFKALDNPRITDFMRLSVPVTWYAQPAFWKSSRFL